MVSFEFSIPDFEFILFEERFFITEVQVHVEFILARECSSRETERA